MGTVQSLSHSKWECIYHITWIPKYRKRKKKFMKSLGNIWVRLSRNPDLSGKECEVMEGHFMADHVYMMMSIPSKYAVAQIIGFIKGKSAIQIARNFVGCKKNFVGQHFWARGYHVPAIGRDEEAIRKYIKEQEEDRRIDQINIFDE